MDVGLHDVEGDLGGAAIQLTGFIRRRHFGWKLGCVQELGTGDPEAVGDVTTARIACVGMYENAQSPVVEHQPGNERCEKARVERDLEHRSGMGTNGLIVPSPEPVRKPHVHRFPDPFGQPSRLRIEIDMSMVAPDLGDPSWAIGHRANSAVEYHSL